MHIIYPEGCLKIIYPQEFDDSQDLIPTLQRCHIATLWTHPAWFWALSSLLETRNRISPLENTRSVPSAHLHEFSMPSKTQHPALWITSRWQGVGRISVKSSNMKSYESNCGEVYNHQLPIENFPPFFFLAVYNSI